MMKKHGMYFFFFLSFLTITLKAQAPSTPNFTGIALDPIPNLPVWQNLTSDPQRKGVGNFRSMITATYKNRGTSSGGAWRHYPGWEGDIAGEHNNGCGWDFMVGTNNAQNANQVTNEAKAVANELTNWLLETVNGVPRMRMRRLGIVYMIWNGKVINFNDDWHFDKKGQPYSGHYNHIHFSFSQAGADGTVSWWKGGSTTPTEPSFVLSPESEKQYIVEGGVKHWLLDIKEVEKRGGIGKDQTITKAAIDAIPTGIAYGSTIPTGNFKRILFKAEGDPNNTVYVVLDGQKRHLCRLPFTNNGLTYTGADVEIVTAASANAVPLGAKLCDAVPPPPSPAPSGQQEHWRWCSNCQSLFHGDMASRCPKGGIHLVTGRNYAIFYGASAIGQVNWRWCKNCSGMFYNGFSSRGVCPAGGQHDGSTSHDYHLNFEAAAPNQQNAWKWCKKCYVLNYGDYQGFCPSGGGAHDNAGSHDYKIPFKN